MLTRFRWWLAKLIVPAKIRLLIRVGRGRLYHYFFELEPLLEIDIPRFRRPTPTPEMAIVDMATAAEGSEPKEMAEWREDPEFDPDFKGRLVPKDILREALKGTPLEGADEDPEPKKPQGLGRGRRGP